MGSIRACYGWESFPIPGAEIFSFRHSGPCNIEIRNRHIHIQLCTTIAKSRRIFVERFAGDAGIVVFILSRSSRLTHTGRRTFGVGQRRPMQRIIRQRHLHCVGQTQGLCFLRDCSYGQRDRCHRGQQLKCQVDALWTRSSGSYFQGMLNANDTKSGFDLCTARLEHRAHRAILRFRETDGALQRFFRNIHPGHDVVHSYRHKYVG